jgi:hypothetical protein
MEITGGCFCGAIEYAATIDVNLVGICHCRDCQILGGSAFRTTAMVTPANFRISKGEPKYFDKTSDSGAIRRMAFCDTCGTHLCSVPHDTQSEGAFVSLRFATSSAFHDVKPAAEIYCASRVSWLNSLEGTLEFPGMPG